MVFSVIHKAGILSSNMMLNWFSADFQSLIGIVHFLAMFFSDVSWL
jgi:hypothetical protein